jgi:DNA polymerase-1
MATLMLIDGNSLTYRAFHALPPDLATASGQVTNAVFGFTSMLINLVRDHRPDGIVVAFDRPEPTFRHDRVDTYKANRAAAPDVLREQMGLVRRVLEVLVVPTVDLAGFEADDIIATLATRAEAEGHDVLIVTGDRDSYQLVHDPHIKVVYNKRGVSDYALYDEAGIRDRTGVDPTDYVAYAALRGDPSDNLPGIPGVGEKTAAKLINTYGDLDGVFANIGDLTPKLRQNLAEHEAQARLNLEVMDLIRDAPLEVEIAGLMTRHPFEMAHVKELFDFLEFRTLFDRLPSAFGDLGPGDAESADTVLEAKLDTRPAAIGVAELIESGSELAIAAGTDVGSLAGIALVPVGDPTAAVTWLPIDEVAAAAPLFAATAPGLVAHDAKPLLRALLDRGVGIDSLHLDTAIAAYLLDPAGSSYPLRELLPRYTDWSVPDASGPPPGQLDFGSNSVAPSQAAATEALAVAQLGPVLRARLADDGLVTLNDDIEVPLVGVLARMEHVGVGVDRVGLQRLNDEMTAEADQLAAQIQLDAGEEFNVNSTKKLQEILFDKLGLTKGKKIKTGFSTDQATLEKLVGEHPIIEHLLRYREVEKLRSTYGESLLASVAPDGRIHATFNQTVARTGRLSSENPNLHNIPVRTEMGRVFRTAFVPAPGTEFLVADYNQIELRCIAHLAHDPGLIEAFTSGTDVHRAVAARVFGIAPGDVDYEQRSRAKMVSYGLAYGMESYGLGQRLGIPTREAAVILDAYFDGFPNVRDYMDATVTEARNRGYTETLFGRRRAIPELRSDNPRVRQAGERQAMNAGIQGLAADIFKVALVRLDERLRAEAMASRIVLQVHDEVILEVPPNEHDVAERVVLDVMQHAFELAVPLEVNLSFGPTWAAAKD